MGFTREQATKALSLGWTRDDLVRFHEFLSVEGQIDRVWDWGVVDVKGNTFYRGIDLLHQRVRLEADPSWLTATAYCDGSGTTLEKPAGIGVYIVHGSGENIDPVLIAENIGLGTNNRAELCAIWRALRQFKSDKELTILSDSEYAIGSLTKDWARNANGGLIRRIREDLEGRTITFEHVDGHSGVEGNEVADRLANVGRKLITTVSVYEG